MFTDLKKFFSLFFLITILLFFGCKSKNDELNLGAKNTITKQNANEASLGQTKDIKYEYDGHSDFNKVRRKINLKVTPTLLDKTNPKGITIELDVKNVGFEIFIMDGDDIFLMKGDEILGTMKEWFSRKEIEPGESAKLTLMVPTALKGMPSTIEFKKRMDEEIKTMFSIKL